MMRCPRCETHPVLEDIARKGVRFHGCRSCKGLLLEKKETVALAQATRGVGAEQRAAQSYDYFNKLVSASEFVRQRQASMPCPHCRYDMYETDNKGVRLDFCMNCQAMWFDAGELQQILQRSRRGEAFILVPLPVSEVDHASGLILQILRDEWL